MGFPQMTLRDYFAAKAMTSLSSEFGKDWDEDWGKAGYQVLAEESYRMADAMLKAREQCP